MMTQYTGYQYIQIDIANGFGLDKDEFEPRIQWVEDNMDDLEDLMVSAEDPFLYIKAVKALRDAQNGIATGHLVGLDQTASGMQIMGALAGCRTTCYNTGLINPNKRSDVYTYTTDVMSRTLGAVVDVERADVKQAQMTHFYKSKNKPKEIFGDNTVELKAFYSANYEVAPGACMVLESLDACWQSDALSHQFTMPDGNVSFIPVMVDMEATIKVDELGGASFTHYWEENQGTATGLSLVANVTHATDGFVVAEMQRRCNYSDFDLMMVSTYLRREVCNRKLNPSKKTDNTQFLSLVHLDKVSSQESLKGWPDDTVIRMYNQVLRVTANDSFELVCVFDEFKCGPNHCNAMRQHFIDIMAELADSNLLEDVINEITGWNVKVDKLNQGVGDMIRGGAYGIC